tara:strand:+ start:372 stop:785 length:414 start_codon:yes stop_codon:yes gene_type:complete
VTNRKRWRNGTAVGVSNDIGTLDLQIIEQCCGVVCHILERLRRVDFLLGPRLFESSLDIGKSQIVEFRRQPDIAIVIGNDEENSIHQGLNQKLWPCKNLRTESTHKQQWLSVPHAPGLIFYFNSVNANLRHPKNSYF